MEGQYLGDVTEVRGVATCLRLSSWSLSYREEGAPDWIDLAQSHKAVADDELLYTWDTSALPEGWYELRLAVYTRTGLQAEETVSVNMTHVPCGDFNGDFQVDLGDVDGFVSWLWEGGEAPFQAAAADVDLSGVVDPGDLDYLEAYVEAPFLSHAPCAWTIGDVNRDFLVDAADATYFTAWLFQGGPAPRPAESADVDCSGQVDLLDLDSLSAYLYRGGPEPGLACYVRGDLNHVGGVNLDDAYYLGHWIWHTGPQPMPMASGDVDCSGQVDYDDFARIADFTLPPGEEIPCP